MGVEENFFYVVGSLVAEFALKGVALEHAVDNLQEIGSIDMVDDMGSSECKVAWTY